MDKPDYRNLTIDQIVDLLEELYKEISTTCIVNTAAIRYDSHGLPALFNEVMRVRSCAERSGVIMSKTYHLQAEAKRILYHNQLEIDEPFGQIIEDFAQRWGSFEWGIQKRKFLGELMRTEPEKFETVVHCEELLITINSYVKEIEVQHAIVTRARNDLQLAVDILKKAEFVAPMYMEPERE